MAHLRKFSVPAVIVALAILAVEKPITPGMWLLIGIFGAGVAYMAWRSA